jgi:hypothetical protein
MMLLSPANILADNNDTPEEIEEDWRIDFMQNRMAKFIEGMDDDLDKGTLISLLENMGRYCAEGNYDKNVKFKGDVDAYLASTKEWVEEAGHDAEKGIIKIVGKKDTSLINS